MRTPTRSLIVLCTCLATTFARAEKNTTDTAKINHVIDGVLTEWNQGKFETDKETEIQYAVDHDETNLYLAIKVPNMRTQMKMMMQGMKLFVDTKGKRRERAGIEFPVKTAGNAQGGGFGQGGNRGDGGGEPGQNGAPDLNAMHDRLSSHLLLLKTFGLEDIEDKTMVLGQTENIGLGCGWDEANVFYIEYMIPLSNLGKTAELKGKTLGIGWKLNGIESAGFGGGAGSSGATLDGGNGRSSGRSAGGGRGRSGGGSSFPPSGTTSNDKRFSDQDFWTKYILTL